MVARASPETRPHLPGLDGVRGVAILLVMAFHFTTYGPGPYRTLDLAVLGPSSIGWAGVDLFFVLSGFLITGILLDERDSPRFYRDFYARRVLRILPLYFAALVVWLVIAPLFARWVPALQVPHGSAPWLWAHASNIYLAITRSYARVPFGTGHFWSLSVEEQFYLLWPFLVRHLRPASLARACVGAIVLAFLSRLFCVVELHNALAAYVLLPCRLDALALGGLLAVLHRDPSALATVRAWLPRLGLAAAAVLVTVMLLLGTATSWLYAYGPVVQVLCYLPIGLVAATLVHRAALGAAGSRL
ncbi:MAG TPA: acyltransferase, partial [Gemmatimonadales bacterium]|nr:acyltransferase [Gemmatimonadales bacterium]